MTKLLFVVALVALCAALVVRVYAAASLVPIRTWDDAGYRTFATQAAAVSSVPEALRELLLPNSTNDLADRRTAGYHRCLVLGLTLFGPEGAERVFQAVNLVLLLIQLGCVYGLARWALPDAGLALAATCTYLLTPIVFGINRWVMTENFVMAGLCVTLCGSARLLLPHHSEREASPSLAWGWSNIARPLAWSWSNIASPLAVGVCIGIFATMREYALPLVIGLVAATALGLLIDRRWLAAGVFSAACAPYLAAAAQAAQPALANATSRAAGATYFHPLADWVVHVMMESWGPFMSLTMLGGVLLTPWTLLRRGFKVQPQHAGRRWPWLNGLLLLWVASGLLGAATMGAVIFSEYRLVRPSIPILLLGLGFLLTGVRLLNVSPDRFAAGLSAYLAAGVAIGVAQQGYHLFVRFDQGASYVHRPKGMEYYNHPLVLRPLAGGGDMHIGPDLPES